ncbi:MAG: hypothetical protein HKN47_06040, partial [Pirellulaceae bacterium]|nr:hypothetical protein [Pirellulaceae bacterium]
MRINKSLRTKKKKTPRCLLAVLAAVTVVSQAGNTLAIEPLQRIGRTYGFGWGDGYHACQKSKMGPMADRPPRSYADLYGERSSTALGHGILADGPLRQRVFAPASASMNADHGRRGVNRASFSLYDRFDASAMTRSGGINCDCAGPCDCGNQLDQSGRC